MLRAELLKVRSMKLPWILVIAVAVIYLLSAILSFAFTDSLASEDPYVVPLLVLSQLLVPILAIAFGAWMGGGEYHWGTWRSVLAHDDRRFLHLATKLGVMAGLVLAASLVTFVGGVLFVSFLAVLRSNSVDLSQVAGVAIGLAIPQITFALVGFTLAVVTKNISAGVTIGFAWLVVVDSLLRVLSNPSIQDRVDLVPFLITTPIGVVRDQFIPAKWILFGALASGNLPEEPSISAAAAWLLLLLWIAAVLLGVAFTVFTRRYMTD